MTNGLVMRIGKIRTIEAGLATHRPVALVIREKELEELVEVVQLARRTKSPEPVFGPHHPADENGWRSFCKDVKEECKRIGAQTMVKS